MIDLLRMWGMCRIFARNEPSWDRDHVKAIVSQPTKLGGSFVYPTPEEISERKIMKLGEAKSYGMPKFNVISSYLHRYRFWLNLKKIDGNTVFIDKTNPRHERKLLYAQIAMNNCIDINNGFIKEDLTDTNRVYMTGKGREFAKWYHPIKVFFHNVYIKGVILSALSLITAYYVAKILGIPQ